MTTPGHWSIDRLKWSINGLIAGIWGHEPNGQDDVICVRVADFDRIRLTVVDVPPTLRAVEPKERRQRLLQPGDLLIEKSGGGDNQLVGCVVDFSHTYTAVCSNFVARMPMAPGMWPRYWTYVHASLYSSRLNLPAIKQTTGIQNLDIDAYLNQRVPFPPRDKQRVIAEYLDRETARLDALVAAKEQVLGLLAEKSRALITRAVTRGLDPRAPLRDSCIPWLGEIPAHWALKRVKYLFKLVADPAPAENDFELLSLYTDIGVRPRKDLEARGNKSTTTDSYWLVKQGDLVVNKLLAWMGAFGVSEYEGVTSPAYDVLRPAGDVNSFYYHHLFRCGICLPEVRRRSYGIMDMRLRLYFDRLGDMFVPVPPFDEQTRIVAAINVDSARIDSIWKATERTIDLLKERRAALIAAAVTGQLEIDQE